jgi:hypothetical protein
MADVKISELPSATTVSDADFVVLNQGGSTKKAQRSLVRGVRAVTAGTGLQGGTITDAGSLSLEPTGVTGGTYGTATKVPQVTVDSLGRITGVAELTISAGGSGTVTSVTAGSGLTGGTITSSGTIGLAASGVTSGVYGSSSQVATLTVDQYGRLTSAASTPISITTAQISGFQQSQSGVTSITAGNGLTGGTITSTGILALTTTGVSQGSYGSSSQVAALTVDQYGRITTATSTAISITTDQISGLSIPTVPTNIVKNNQSDTTPVNFIRALTQAEYDAISPKDPNTVYFIKS